MSNNSAGQEPSGVLLHRQIDAAPKLPFTPLPEIDAAMCRELKAAALDANQRYLVDQIEEHSFCPYSRGGRAQEQTERYVHYYSESDVRPLIEFMAKAASDPGLVVVQVILPMIETDPEEWIDFCHKVTDLGNEYLGAGTETFAVAPLHPALAYKDTTPFALIPLFRRSPDPTIQWVRLDGLTALYAGRERDTKYVDPSDIMAFMEEKHQQPLFDRIAETNLLMANRLGIPRVEEALSNISVAAQKRYMNILLGGTSGLPQDAPSKKACPCSGQDAPVKTEPPIVATLCEEGWQLIAFRDLKQREPRHVQVEDVDLVVVRIGASAHVLYGRCPHRLALLSDALVENTRLVCRHHGWDFSLDTGASEGVPGESVHRFAAWLDDGQVWIKPADVRRWRIEHPQAFKPGELVP
ncbi:MAG: Rieske 2Fe-2S domain-containing protein [Myxococcales bacterium]|nr:Rieske 2Fe-2S domain-containing protein [Myxococcales bacterium]